MTYMSLSAYEKQESRNAEIDVRAEELTEEYADEILASDKSIEEFVMWQEIDIWGPIQQIMAGNDLAVGDLRSLLRDKARKLVEQRALEEAESEIRNGGVGW